MSANPLAILGTGLVTPVGLTAPAACAAIRAGLANPEATRFLDSEGEWISAHRVPLDQMWVGRTKLEKMATQAITECLVRLPPESWAQVPLIMCVAERGRAGRMAGLDDELFLGIQQLLGFELAAESLVVPQGRGAVATALLHARRLIETEQRPYVIIAAADSFLHWPTLVRFEEAERLLAGGNSNGFIPGEAAGALLVGRPTGQSELLCTGIGFAVETATLESEQPLRGDGLAGAIKSSLADAGRAMHECDLRIADLSGEQYYFKEAALALARTLKSPKETFELWHPAECIGETGAAIGAVMIAVADAACRKAYAPGSRILMHFADDDGRRAALVAEFGVA